MTIDQTTALVDTLAYQLRRMSLEVMHVQTLLAAIGGATDDAFKRNTDQTGWDEVCDLIDAAHDKCESVQARSLSRADVVGNASDHRIAVLKDERRAA